MVTEQLLKKTSLWPLPFFMALVTYSHYEKVRRTMRAEIVLYALNPIPILVLHALIPVSKITWNTYLNF